MLGNEVTSKHANNYLCIAVLYSHIQAAIYPVENIIILYKVLIVENQTMDLWLYLTEEQRLVHPHCSSSLYKQI